jgi:hypothetical protein
MPFGQENFWEDGFFSLTELFAGGGVIGAVALLPFTVNVALGARTFTGT